MTDLYKDGASGAPAGTPLLPTILNGYAARPPWQVAGVDYAVGVAAGTALLNPATIAMAGVTVNTANHTVTITGNDVTLNGYDFSQGDYSVVVQGSSDTIKNSNFVVGSNQGSRGTVLNVTSAARNFSLVGNNINGNNVAVTPQVGATVIVASSGRLNIQYNNFHNSGGDMIDINQSAAPEVDVVQYNLFNNIGINTAHSDTIQWYGTQTAAGSDIGFNTIYQNANLTNGMGGLVPGTGGAQSSVNGLTVNNDTIIQTAAYTNANTTMGFDDDAGVSASNIIIHDLYIDPTGVMGYTGSPWFPTGYYGGSLGESTVMSNVINMVTGAQVPVPSASNKTAQGYYVYPDVAGNSPVLSDVYNVTASPASGILSVGSIITFTVNLDENFTVTGTPTLTLNDGGTAAYSSGSGTKALTFTYTVTKTDTAVSALVSTGVNLPGGATVKDSVGNPANLAGARARFSALAIAAGSSSPTPVAAADIASTAQNKSVTIVVLTNDTDVGGTINQASVAVTTPAAHGSTVVNANTGAVTYTPASGFTGTDTFKYTVANTNGITSAPAPVTVTVNQSAGSGPSGYADGASGAPAGPPQLPMLLNGYAARPPWQVAGVDYAVGVAAGTALLNPATIAMAGATVNIANHTVTITGNNVTLNGYDFSQAGGWGININTGAANTIIENCNFLVGSNNQVPVNAVAGAGSLTLQGNTFDGGGSQTYTVWALVNYNGSGTFVAKYNSFLNAQADAIDFSGGTITPVIEYNLFDNLGTASGAHPDPVQYVATNTTNAVEAFNTIYQPNPVGGEEGIDPGGANGSKMTNATIENNVIVAKGPGIDMSCSIAVIQAPGNTINGVVVGNNYIDYTGTYYPFYPPTGSNLTFTGNVNMVNGAQIANPSGVAPQSASPTAPSTYYVSAATLAARSVAGCSNGLVVNRGGTVAVDSLAAINSVQLGAPTNFVATSTAGLEITGSSAGGDTITLGAPTQSVTGGGANERVIATAVNAADRIIGLGSNSMLEVTTGGSITLNPATEVTTVQLDKVSTLVLNAMSFITATGTAGGDTIQAGGAYQVLSGGRGANTLIGSNAGYDTFRNVGAGLNGDSIQNFVSSDAIHATDMAFQGANLSTVNNGQNTMVTLTSGATTAAFTMAGAWSANGFHLANDGQGGTLVTHT